jgi:aspartate/methionine/tyrosine aminotransferase
VFSYDSLLSIFRRLVPVPTALKASNGYKLDIVAFRVSPPLVSMNCPSQNCVPQNEVKEKGISVVVASNPRNPTGQAIEGHELESLVEMAAQGTTVVLDEVRMTIRVEVVARFTLNRHC